MNVIEVTRLVASATATGRGRRCLLHRRGGRDLRHPRPQRRRQDHDRGVHRGAADAGLAATISVLGLDPRVTGPSCPSGSASSCRRASCPTGSGSREALDSTARSTASPADWRALHGRPRAGGQARAPRSRKLSGGQKQRLSIALALIGNPKVAVLDELTTGLDPQARRDTWQLIEDVRARGVTIVLVTHFMEEAERLCDRLALIDAGRVVALDTPAGLVSRVDAEQRIRFRPVRPDRRRAADRAARGPRRAATARWSWSPATATSERRHLRAGPQPDRRRTSCASSRPVSTTRSSR